MRRRLGSLARLCESIMPTLLSGRVMKNTLACSICLVTTLLLAAGRDARAQATSVVTIPQSSFGSNTLDETLASRLTTPMPSIMQAQTTSFTPAAIPLLARQAVMFSAKPVLHLHPQFPIF